MLTLKVCLPLPPVPQVSASRSRAGLDVEGLGAHGAGEADDLVDGLALEPQRGEEGRGLGLGGVAGHDVVEGGGGLIFGEVAAVVDEGVEGLCDRRGEGGHGACFCGRGASV